MLSAVSDLRALRATVARIERGREGSAAGHRRLMPLGDGALPLDTALGGGLCSGTLHEVTAQAPRDAAPAAGFAAALATRCTPDGSLIWIVDDRAAWETGTPCRQGLAAHGLDPDKLLLVRTRDAASTLWAAEEALRAGGGVVLVELWRGQSYDLAASRRLLLAARRRGATGLILHVGLDPALVSSAADTRFAVAARPGKHRAAAAGRVPIPGRLAFAVRLLKRRDRDDCPGFDRDQVHALVWDREVRAFAEADRAGDRSSVPSEAAEPHTIGHAPLLPLRQKVDRAVRRETDEGSTPKSRVVRDPSSGTSRHLLPQGEKGFPFGISAVTQLTEGGWA